METFKEYLERHEACKPAIKYAKSLDFNVTSVIENCPQADWLIWVVAQEPETFGITTHSLVEYALKAWEAAWAANDAAWAAAAWAATEDHPELRTKLWELVDPIKVKIIDSFQNK